MSELVLRSKLNDGSVIRTHISVICVQEERKGESIPKPAPRRIRTDESSSKMRPLETEEDSNTVIINNNSLSFDSLEGNQQQQQQHLQSTKIYINNEGDWVLDQDDNIPDDWKPQDEHDPVIRIKERLIWSTIEEESETEVAETELVTHNNKNSNNIIIINDDVVDDDDEDDDDDNNNNDNNGNNASNREQSPEATSSTDSGVIDSSREDVFTPEVINVKNIAKIWENEGENSQQEVKKWKSMPDLKQQKSNSSRKSSHVSIPEVSSRFPDNDNDDRDVCMLVPIKERLRIFESLASNAKKEKMKMWSSMPSLDDDVDNNNEDNHSKRPSHSLRPSTTYYHRSPSLIVGEKKTATSKMSLSTPIALVGSCLNLRNRSSTEDFELVPLRDRMQAYVRQASKSPEAVRTDSPTIEAMKGSRKINHVQEQKREDIEDTLSLSKKESLLEDCFLSGDETESLTSSNTSASTVISASKVNNHDDDMVMTATVARVIPTYSYNDESNGEIYSEGCLYVVENGKEFPLTSLSQRKQLFDGVKGNPCWNLSHKRQSQQQQQKKWMNKCNDTMEQIIIKSAAIPYIKEEQNVLQNIHLVKAMKEKFK